MKNYLYDNQKVIINPGMGWVMHTSIEKGYKDHNEFDPEPYIGIVALLSSWAKIEVKENVFDFQDLDDAVNSWIKLGKKIHLRISTDPMIYRDSAYGVPDWLFETYQIPYQEKEIYGLKAKFPDYLHPIYLDKVYKFVDKLVTRYCHHKQIVLMDLRGYGEWGEWHSGYMHPSIDLHVLALRSIIQTWDKACNGRIPLALSASYEWRRDQSLMLFSPKNFTEYLYFSGFDYALTKSKTITYRRDGIGGALKYYDYELFQTYFTYHHYHPLTTEFFIAYERQKDSIDGVRGYYAEDALEEALALHPNYMMLMWDSRSFFKERKDLIEHGLKRMGYRLFPSVVEATIDDYTITLSHHWENHGVGRLYEEHQCIIRIKDDKNRNHQFEDDHVNLHNVIESNSQTFTTIIIINSQIKISSISIGIYLKESQEWMKMPLDDDNGFYLICTK